MSSSLGNGENMVGYPATLTNHKRYQKRRSFYDKAHLDMAVDLVIKNKLSMRAASHIYKIPFSTLRTRKVFLTCGMTAAEYDKLNKLKNSGNAAASMINKTSPVSKAAMTGAKAPTMAAVAASGTDSLPFDDEDDNYDDLIDESYDDNEFTGGDPGSGDDMPDDSVINESNNKGNNTSTNLNNSTSHQQYPTFSVISLNGGNQGKKSDVNLPNQQLTNNFNNTTNLNSNQQSQQKQTFVKQGIDQMKSSNNTNTLRVTASGAGNKINTILQNMRALSSQQHTQNGVNSNVGIKSVNAVQNSPNNAVRGVTVNGRHSLGATNMSHFRATTSPNILSSTNGNVLNATSNTNANKMGNVQPSLAKPQQANQTAQFKLSSILSATTLSLKNKSIIPTVAAAAAASVRPMQPQPKPIQIKSDASEKFTSNESLTNSEYLTRTTTAAAAAESDKSLYKCKQCDLLFLNSYFLHQHLNSSPKHQQQTSPPTTTTATAVAKKDSDRVVYVDALDSNKHFTCSFCTLTTLDKISFLAHVPLCSSTLSS